MEEFGIGVMHRVTVQRAKATIETTRFESHANQHRERCGAVCRGKYVMWVLSVVVLIATLSKNSVAAPPATPPASPSVTPASVEAQISAGQLDAAVDAIRNLDETTTDVDWTRTLAMLASRFQQQNDVAAAAEFYFRAIRASENPVARELPPDKISLLRIAAASTLVQANRASDAFHVLTWNVENDSDLVRSGTTSKLMLSVGARALASGDAAIALKAYETAKHQLTGDAAIQAELGYAWAIAVSRERPLDAAQHLAAFATRYPEHADAPRAVRACISCLQEAGRHDEAGIAIEQLLKEWPTSQSAVDVVASFIANDRAERISKTSNDAKDAHGAVAPPTLPPYIVEWIVANATHTEFAGVSDRMLGTAILAVADTADTETWNVLATSLGAKDATGQETSDTLHQLTQSSRSTHAERLASALISPLVPGTISPASREAACRWAGRNQHWSMLAMAAEREQPTSTDSSLSLGCKRLFAEGLMQAGRTEEAHAWWQYLVNEGQSTDFPTLLRAAETAVAHASVQDAIERLNVARDAAAGDSFRENLLRLLGADLSIRQLNFDEARSLLETVVRDNGQIGSLRPRAQWLIGETYFMQQRFAEAVEAYRTVENMDPDGQWVAASIVQAGKSFEQLGRTREAAVCYSTLLARHGSSPYAEDARRRLAAIAPTGTPSSDTIRR